MLSVSALSALRECVECVGFVECVEFVKCVVGVDCTT